MVGGGSIDLLVLNIWFGDRQQGGGLNVCISLGLALSVGEGMTQGGADLEAVGYEGMGN